MRDAAVNALVTAVVQYVKDDPHPLLNRFEENLTNWGDKRVDVDPKDSPVADILQQSSLNTTSRTRALIDLFARHSHTLFWEQSYTREDCVVGEAMLAGYGFTELVGERGPCVSTRTRCGIGIWMPGIEYPIHRHQAEEIYYVLGGSASFTVEENRDVRKCPEGVVYVAANQRHGFRTEDEALVVLYLWQNGDLRQKSSFSD